MSNVHSFDKHHLVKVLYPIATQASADGSWEQVFADAELVVYELNTGAITENVTVQLEQAQNSGGTLGKDITGATVTITSTTDVSVATIEIGPGALDEANGFTYVRPVITVAGSASELWSLNMIKHRLRYPGGRAQDATYRTPVRVY